MQSGGGMERQKMKHRRQLGLRQGMLGIILLCWVLPVVLIVTLGGVYILDSMTRQYRSDMMRSAQSAASCCPEYIHRPA